MTVVLVCHGNLATAREYTGEAMSSQPSDQEFSALVEHFGANRFDQVIAGGQDLLQRHPQAPLLHNLIGAALTRMGQLDEAVTWYRRAVTVQPDFVDAWSNLAGVLYKLKNLPEAAECYRRLLASSPVEIDISLKLARVLKEMGACDEAVAVLDRVLVDAPTHAEALNWLGVIHAEARRFDVAIAYFERVLAVQRDHATALSNIGAILHKTERYADALPYYRRICELDPQNATKLARLALALVLEGCHDEASACYRRLLTLKLDAKTLRDLVRSLGLMGKLTDASIVGVEVERANRKLKVFSADQLPALSSGTALAAAETIPGGTVHTNWSLNRQQTTRAFTGLSVSLLKIESAEILPPNVLVTEDSLIDAGNGYGCLEGVAHTRHPALRLRATTKMLTFSIVEPASHVAIDGPVGVLMAQDNYSSWLLGEMTRAALYREAAPDINIVLLGKPRPFHWDSLAYCGYTPDNIRVLDQGEGLRIRDLRYVTPTYFHHTGSIKALSAVRQRLLARLKVDADFGRSIYISRSRLGPNHDRRIKNEIDVERFLEARGFEIVHPQELSFTEQVKVFSSARRIVAPFGAALASSIFCDRRVKACIIRTKRTPEFDRIFQWLGLDLAHVSCVDSIVELNELDRFLDSIAG